MTILLLQIYANKIEESLDSDGHNNCNNWPSGKNTGVKFGEDFFLMFCFVHCSLQDKEKLAAEKSEKTAKLRKNHFPMIY